MMNKKIYTRIALIALFVVNFLYFWRFKDIGIIMGDDIKLVTYFSDRSVSIVDKVLTNSSFLNYRPIAYSIICLEVYLFGNVYLGYFMFQVLLNFINIYSIFWITKKICDGHSIIGFIVSLLYIVSPCAYYGITQIFGTMELLCIFWSVWLFYMGIKYSENRSNRYFLLCVLLYSMALFSHERTMVYIGFLFVLIVLRFKTESKKTIIGRLLIATVPLIVNYFIKTTILHMHFFEGTGGTSIQVNFKSAFDLLARGIMLVFGINLGPEYLNAISFNELNVFLKTILILSLIFQILVIVLYSVNSIKNYRKETKNLDILILGISMCGVSIVSFCLTIRLEMRWMYIPCTIYFITLFYLILHCNISKNIYKILGTVIFGAFILFSVNFSTGVDRLFFFRAMHMQQSLYEETIFKYGKKIKDYDIIVVYNNELEWAMQGSQFFEVYLGDMLNVFTVPEEEVYNTYQECNLQGKQAKIFSLEGLDVVENDISYFLTE